MNRCSDTFAYWREHGLTVRAANLLINLSCYNIDDVRRAGQEEIKRSHGMGPPTFNEIAELLHWEPLPVPDRKLRKVLRKESDSGDDRDGLVTAVLRPTEARL